MPLNVGISASARIELLDSLFRHDRWWSKEELLSEINKQVEAIKEKRISDATLRNDLEEIRNIAHENFMEEIRGRQKKYYRYQSRDYSIYNIERLLPEDYDCIQQAIGLLQQIKGFAIAHDLETIITKLKYTYPKANQSPMVLFDSPEHFEGMELMQQVYDAIQKQQVIHFLYKAFNKALPEDFTVHPYLIKEYNNRWYLVGYTVPQNEIWTFALDRFKSDPKPKPRVNYIGASMVEFDPYLHFADVIGPTVIRDHPIEEVRLKFSRARTPYIVTKPLHNSQQLIDVQKNGSASFTYQLRFNKELLSTLLGFGEDVKVIRPNHLKEKILRQVKKMETFY